MTRDLSLGGVRFISDNFIPAHSVLRLEIKLEYGHFEKTIYAIARLIWIREIFDDERYEVGAEFIDISGEDLKFLSDYFNLSKK